MKRLWVALTLLVSACAWGQLQTTPNLGLVMPPPNYPSWDTIMNSNMMKIDLGVVSYGYQGNWISTKTYPLNAMVSYNLLLYASTMNGNLNNTPGVGTAWTQRNFAPRSRD